MRKLLLCLALLGMVAGASADENDLAGGAFITHYVPELGYSTDPPADGWCVAYGQYAITTCEEQVNMIETSTYLGSSWYVLSAWNEAKVWCGTEFGFGDYNAQIFGFTEWAACYPEAGLEIPTDLWPGPLQGTAFVVTGLEWMGTFVPVYWFGGYAYSYYGTGVIPVDVDPPTGFVGWSNCLNPPQSYPAYAMGGLGINEPGIDACFGVIEYFACCVGIDCYNVQSEDECIAMGGEFYPTENCDTFECPAPPEGACCVPGVPCYVTTEEECLLVGGMWYMDNMCDPNPCEAVCCFEHLCEILLEEDCLTGGGMFHPEWFDCLEPENPCLIYTATDDPTWGSIKALYR